MLADNLAQAILAKIFPAQSYQEYVSRNAEHSAEGNQEMRDWTQTGEWLGSSGFSDTIPLSGENKNQWNTISVPIKNLYIQGGNPPLISVKILPANRNRDKLILQNDSQFDLQIAPGNFQLSGDPDIGIPKLNFSISSQTIYDKLDNWTNELWVGISPSSAGTQLIPSTNDILIILEHLKS